MCTKYYSENLKGRDHLREIDVDGRIISKMYRKETECDEMNWIHLAQGIVQWKALVKMAMDL
jgi:hypothetical protein